MFKNVIRKKIKINAEDFATIIDMMFNKFTTTINLDEIIKKYSATVDEFILKTEKKDSLNYIGGKFKMKLVENQVIIIVECYFKNNNDEWIRKNSENKIDINRLDELSLQRLRKENGLEFDIAKPE